ncbi:GFA family protein [Mesorhizobium sp. M0751]|uniref:GFA family protein n=1 Tax=unclassified Mesorhizobium TaxID=325217 RepID=UPI003339FAED
MADAQCVCGALRLMMREPTKLVAACHCLACQRRTGTSFSVNAFYATDTVEISGVATEFIRVADSGRNVRMYFCPTCGSTVYWKPDAQPTIIGVAVGALADPDFPPPMISIFERYKHHWVTLPEETECFQASMIKEYSPDLTRRSL